MARKLDQTFDPGHQSSMGQGDPCARAVGVTGVVAAAPGDGFVAAVSRHASGGVFGRLAAGAQRRGARQHLLATREAAHCLRSAMSRVVRQQGGAPTGMCAAA